MTRVVVDGSNLATEGRSAPSLAQLRDCCAEFRAEHPTAELTVVVDASFPRRIADGERPDYEAALAEGWLLAPPDGVVGRGDAFILAIAARSDAVVLSNDSFREFQGDHPWLLDAGRVVGGKPLRGIGWIFVERRPVRCRTAPGGRSGAGRSAAARGARQTGRGRRARRTGASGRGGR